LYPLWAWHPDRPETSLVSAEQARALVAAALPRLRAAAGLAASDEASRGPLTQTRPARQWDYPYGWAPHQMIAWRALRRRGFDDEANDLIYRWLYTITVNAVDYNGTVPEKLDVVEGSHDVFAEYGNVGTKFEYITEEGFGWMNASYQVGLAMLPGSLQRCLERLVPPEEIDGCD
jgi:alpha,alpha-trehalase